MDKKFKLQICRIGFKRSIELLVEKGANVNAASKRTKMTPLLILLDSDQDRWVEWTSDDTISKLNFIFGILAECDKTS